MENLKTNSFDFLDEINDSDLKNEKPKNKQDLYDYLDGFDFVGLFEVIAAVQVFFIEECGVFETTYRELMEYEKLANERAKSRECNFD